MRSSRLTVLDLIGPLVTCRLLGTLTCRSVVESTLAMDMARSTAVLLHVIAVLIGVLLDYVCMLSVVLIGVMLWNMIA